MSWQEFYPLLEIEFCTCIRMSNKIKTFIFSMHVIPTAILFQVKWKHGILENRWLFFSCVAGILLYTLKLAYLLPECGLIYSYIFLLWVTIIKDVASSFSLTDEIHPWRLSRWILQPTWPKLPLCVCVKLHHSCSIQKFHLLLVHHAPYRNNFSINYPTLCKICWTKQCKMETCHNYYCYWSFWVIFMYCRSSSFFIHIQRFFFRVSNICAVSTTLFI